MANDTNEKGYVVFENSAGEEISNDPRWHAERILGLNQDAGVDEAARLAEEERRELEELREFKRTHGVAQAPQDPSFTGDADDDDDPDEDDDETEAPGPYDEVKGKDLSALAKERGIELTVDGKKLTAPEVRNALAAQDLGRAAA